MMGSAEFRRTGLGGRSGSFAIDDARGDLHTTLVFKPVNSREVGAREAEQLSVLAEAIATKGTEDRFAVPVSLGVHTSADGAHVHVIERHPGRMLSDYNVDERATYLGECAVLLAIYHQSMGNAAPGQSGWQPLKNELKQWRSSLFPIATVADLFVKNMKEALPPSLPLFRKRDAHVGNWMVDHAGRIVAIDLGSPVFLPVGHDLVQLVEDGATLPVSDPGFQRRYTLFRAYLSDIGIMDLTTTEETYDWFALYRAIRLGTSATSTKAQHSHARQLARHVADAGHGGKLRNVTEEVSTAMRAIMPADNPSQLTAGQRRISKAMSRVLRHSAPAAGLSPDDGGFVSLDELAAEIRQPVGTIIDIATHPSEPRFQVIEDSRIRALYGHSFAVPNPHEVVTEMPDTLYHGTSWDHLSQISAQGLLPGSRQYVHLTNNPAEAIEVARRHGYPVLISVSTASIVSLAAVADAVWAATEISPAGIRLVNAFAELSTPPEWLTEGLSVEDR